MLVYFSMQRHCHVYFTGKSFLLQVGEKDGDEKLSQRVHALTHHIKYNQSIFHPAVKR